MGERKSKAMSHLNQNKAERTRGDMLPTRVSTGQNDEERAEQVRMAE